MTSQNKILNFKSKNKIPPTKKETIKNWLSITKDILDIAWRVAPPLSLAFAGLFLWMYLKHIQWSGLFYESAMTGTGLTFLVLAAVSLSTISLFILSTPSILMGITLSYFDKNQKINKEIFTIYLIALISWLAVINVSPYIDEAYAWIFIAPIITTSLYGYVKSDKLENSTSATHSRKWKIANTLAVILMSNFAIFGIIFPIFFFDGIMSHYAANVNNEISNKTITLLFIPLATLAPGLMYLMLRKTNTGAHNLIKVLANTSIIFIYSTFFLVLIFTPASKILLESTEIYNNNKKKFQILKPELKEIIKNTNIETRSDGELSTISAYIRYSFAGTKLICNEPLEFIDFSNSTSKKRNKIDKSSTLNCVATVPGDLREFSN
ncbi:hypothetical protein [Janthinobacterium violaceinigrum]|uniref:DUF4153 domain-containing protein n=1 Tax=Janthinobacterium violaceinigrum TaxID=2654252 RepID=A0A6I1I533_9BURK|nr:hypothetical protein [Janthinobacterium violaceinigrum]KAB8065080.1 hypothetical protein GCN75_10615 [Janthinobacterium violaceinigrum]